MIYKDAKLRIPSKILKKLDVKKGDVLEVQITKVFVESSIKKEMVSLID